jgi:hypothetical protein
LKSLSFSAGVSFLALTLLTPGGKTQPKRSQGSILWVSLTLG